MKRRVLVLLLISLLAINALGQTGGSLQNVESNTVLTGTVCDINGSVIVRGRVAAYTPEGKKYEAVTDGEGIYRIELPVGVYRIEADAPGFSPTRRERFKVVGSGDGRMSVDFVLEVPGAPRRKHEPAKQKPGRRKPDILWSIAD